MPAGFPVASMDSWLAFNRIFGASPRVAGRVLAYAGSPAVALRLDPSEIRQLRLSEGVAGRLRDPDWQGVESDLRWLSKPCRSLVWLGHGNYPRLLAQVPDPPPVLFVKGDPEALQWPMVAIVGSRNASTTGREVAHEFARTLGASGVGVVSGLALGIDGAAHRGALRSAAPTVAVCAQGLDRVYPAIHEELAEAISASGALVSEFPVGTVPSRSNFPRRNRLISGLSMGVLVVEASRRSGALITARQAIEQGRDVFAVPGSIRNPLARGCHELIRAGAKLVECVEDVLEEITGFLETKPEAGIGREPSAEGADWPAGTGPASPGRICGGPATPSARIRGSAPAAQPIEAFVEMPGENRAPAPPRDPEGTTTPLDENARRVLESLGFEANTVDLMVARLGLTAETLSSILLALELDGYVRSTADGSYERVLGHEGSGPRPDGALE